MIRVLDRSPMLKWLSYELKGSAYPILLGLLATFSFYWWAAPTLLSVGTAHPTFRD
jgi:hypothetical protein